MSSATSSPRQNVRVLTWNLENFGYQSSHPTPTDPQTNQAKVNKIANVARNYDLVIFQEISDRIGFNSGIDDESEGLKAQLDNVGLNRYYPRGFEDTEQHNVVIFWKGRKFPLDGTEIDTSNFFQRMGACQSLQAIAPHKYRIIGKVLSFGANVEPQILVIGVHLKLIAADADQKDNPTQHATHETDKRIHKNQIQCIEQIKKEYGKNKLVIIAGDFNDLKNYGVSERLGGFALRGVRSRKDAVYFSAGYGASRLPGIRGLRPTYSDHDALPVRFTVTTRTISAEELEAREQAEEESVQQMIKNREPITLAGGFKLKYSKKKKTGRRAYEEYDDIAYYDDVYIDKQHTPLILESSNMYYGDSQLQNVEYIYIWGILLLVSLLYLVICTACGCFVGYYGTKNDIVDNGCANEQHKEV
eukprot:277068_1